jgi:hypothetical protein
LWRDMRTLMIQSFPSFTMAPIIQVLARLVNLPFFIHSFSIRLLCSGEHDLTIELIAT